MLNENSDKVILDLCGGTGEWGKEYERAGYDYRNITLPNYNVLTYEPPVNIYGVLAAPPCNCFSRVGARWWAEMDADGRTDKAIQIFRKCWELCQLATKFWCLENPPGRQFKLMPELPPPTWQFQPYHFSNPWVKQTYLWGKFNPPWPTAMVMPQTTRRAPSGHTYGKIASLSSSSPERARTPDGFARAFYEANK